MVSAIAFSMTHCLEQRSASLRLCNWSFKMLLNSLRSSIIRITVKKP